MEAFLSYSFNKVRIAPPSPQNVQWKRIWIFLLQNGSRLEQHEDSLDRVPCDPHRALEMACVTNPAVARSRIVLTYTGARLDNPSMLSIQELSYRPLAFGGNGNC